MHLSGIATHLAGTIEYVRCSISLPGAQKGTSVQITECRNRIKRIPGNSTSAVLKSLKTFGVPIMIRCIHCSCALLVCLVHFCPASADEPIDLVFKPDVYLYEIDATVEPIMTITPPKNAHANLSVPEIILPGDDRILLEPGKQHSLVIQLGNDSLPAQIMVYPSTAIRQSYKSSNGRGSSTKE